MARYDWLQAYDAAKAGTYGDVSGDVLARIKSAAGDDFAAAQKAGIIREDGGVNWEKAPALAGYNSAGGDAPKNMSLQATGGRAGMVNPDGSAITSGYGGSQLYNNSDYGTQYVAQNRAPDSWQMQLGRALAVGGFGGVASAALAPLITSGLGLSGSGWNTAVGSLLRSAPGLAMSGGQNWMSVLGKVLGGATGLPGGSTIGGLAGSYAQMTPEQRAALAKSIGGG